MHLTYGGYPFAENEVWFNITKRAIFSPRGRREKEAQRWDIFGSVFSPTSSESELTSKMQALENAVSTNGGDLKFIGNSGGTTRHTLISSETLSGTQVESFNWLAGKFRGSGTEYINQRSYHIVITGEKLWSEDELYFYRTTLSVTGTTGPKKLFVPSLTGIPQGQIIQAATTQKVVQSGMNIGLTGYIAADGPLFPISVEHLDRRQITTLSPQDINSNQSLRFPTRWSYFFESQIPLI